MMKTVNTLLVGFVLLLMVQSATARERYNYQQPWAERYAQIAMAQVRDMHKLSCRHKGDRWSTDYYSHLRWASRHSRSKADREIRRRDERLRDCHKDFHRYTSSNSCPTPYYEQARYGENSRYRDERRYQDEYRYRDDRRYRGIPWNQDSHEHDNHCDHQDSRYPQPYSSRYNSANRLGWSITLTN